MAVLFSNNAVSTLSTSITNAQTDITLASGGGNKFPAPTAGDWFYATIVDTSGNIEIVKCTERNSDTLTVERGQDGTSALAFASGSRVELRLCKAAIQDILVQFATQEEVDAGTVANKAVTPATLASRLAATSPVGSTLYLYHNYGGNLSK